MCNKSVDYYVKLIFWYVLVNVIYIYSNINLIFRFVYR